MSTRPDDSSGDRDAAASNTGLTHIADAVGDLFSGTHIPAPIRRNALKAFNQLCSAAIDVPLAYLEGVAAEKRAETEARTKIITTGAEQIAAQMNVDPEYAKAAVKKFGQRILREQVNLDRVAEAAARQLNEPRAQSAEPESQTSAESPPLDEDWLNAFEKEASQKSGEEMQQLFSRILAGEIRKPASFSTKTIRLLGQLDARVARLFHRLCSLSISLRPPERTLDARVVSLGGSAAANSLQRFGLGFDALNSLHEYGLIIPDYNSYMDYRVSVAVDGRVGLPFTYQNAKWVLLPEQGVNAPQAVHVHGVALSRSGAELLTIVDLAEDDVYTKSLQDFFANHKLSMARLSDEPRV